MYELIEILLGKSGEVLQIINMGTATQLQELVDKARAVEKEFQECGFLTIENEEVFGVKHEFYQEDKLLFKIEVM